MNPELASGESARGALPGCGNRSLRGERTLLAPRLTEDTSGPKKAAPSSPHLGGRPSWDPQTMAVSNRAAISRTRQCPRAEDFSHLVSADSSFIRIAPSLLGLPLKKKLSSQDEARARTGATRAHFYLDTDSSIHSLKRCSDS